MIYQIRKWIRNLYHQLNRQLRWAVKPPIYIKKGESLAGVLARSKPGDTIIMAVDPKDWEDAVGSNGESV